MGKTVFVLEKKPITLHYLNESVADGDPDCILAMEAIEANRNRT